MIKIIEPERLSQATLYMANADNERFCVSRSIRIFGNTKDSWESTYVFNTFMSVIDIIGFLPDRKVAITSIVKPNMFHMTIGLTHDVECDFYLDRIAIPFALYFPSTFRKDYESLADKIRMAAKEMFGDSPICLKTADEMISDDNILDFLDPRKQGIDDPAKAEEFVSQYAWFLKKAEHLIERKNTK